MCSEREHRYTAALCVERAVDQVQDVRHGPIQRVAAVVGDGSVAIRLLHEYLAPE